MSNQQNGKTLSNQAQPFDYVRQRRAWQSQPYNGWANWHTWNFALWICNDPGVESLVVDMADVYRKELPETKVVKEFSRWLKDNARELLPPYNGSPTKLGDDIKLSAVNYGELAVAWLYQE